jgi:MoaA/NifB/PqqE/SkfB family radical SAM enzyme
MIQKKEIIKLEIELNNVCPLSCPMCLRTTIDKEYFLDKTKFISLRDIDLIMDELPNLKYVELVGSISEPTTHPDFLEIIKYLKTKKLKIFISTNANTRNKEFWANLGLLLNKDDIINFAIDGSTQKIYEKYRVNGNLQRVKNNIRFFRKVNKSTFLNLQNIKFSHNKDDKENILELAKDLGFNSIEYLPCGEPDPDQRHLITTKEYKQFLFKNKLNKSISKTGKINVYCQYDLDKGIFLSFDSKLYICCEYDKKRDRPKISESMEEAFNLLNKEYNDICNTTCCQKNCSRYSYKLYNQNRTEIINLENNNDILVIPYWNKSFIFNPEESYHDK